MDAVVKLEAGATFTPPALDADEPIAEAELAIARTDVRMMLDGGSPPTTPPKPCAAPRRLTGAKLTDWNRQQAHKSVRTAHQVVKQAGHFALADRGPRKT